jgi:hypothetical protein
MTEIQRILQEVASAQDDAEVLGICCRLADLRLSPLARERLSERIADLRQEAGAPTAGERP